MPQAEVDSRFLPELWTEYSIGVLVIFFRFLVRVKTVGVRGFQGDDYCAVLVLFFWTADAVLVHVIYYTGSNVQAVRSSQLFSVSILAELEYGSKCLLAAWYSYTGLLWSMKASMLFLFSRLAFGLWQTKVIKWFAVFCAVSYLAVFLTITFGCHPLKLNWQVVPSPPEHCTFHTQNFLVLFVLNVLTDAGLIAIPVPALWALRIPVRRKIFIAALLSSGIFVIAAAIVRVAFVFSGSRGVIIVNLWGVRETTVGIITINVPILGPALRGRFWIKSPSGDAHNRQRTAPSKRFPVAAGASALLPTHTLADPEQGCIIEGLEGGGARMEEQNGTAVRLGRDKEALEREGEGEGEKGAEVGCEDWQSMERTVSGALSSCVNGGSKLLNNSSSAPNTRS